MDLRPVLPEEMVDIYGPNWHAMRHNAGKLEPWWRRSNTIVMSAKRLMKEAGVSDTEGSPGVTWL